MSEEAKILSNSGCSQRHEFGVGPSYLRSESQSSEGDHRLRRGPQSDRRETTDFGEDHRVIGAVHRALRAKRKIKNSI